MKMFLISDNIDTATGMRLTGIEGVVVHEYNETVEAIKKAIADNDIGIIILTEIIAELIPDYVDKIKLEMPKKLIAVVPDRHGSRLSKDRITSYVNEAIGLKF